MRALRIRLLLYFRNLSMYTDISIEYRHEPARLRRLEDSRVCILDTVIYLDMSDEQYQKVSVEDYL